MPSVALSSSASAPVGSYCARPAELLRAGASARGEGGASERGARLRSTARPLKASRHSASAARSGGCTSRAYGAVSVLSCAPPRQRRADEAAPPRRTLSNTQPTKPAARSECQSTALMSLTDTCGSASGACPPCNSGAKTKHPASARPFRYARRGGAHHHDAHEQLYARHVQVLAKLAERRRHGVCGEGAAGGSGARAGRSEPARKQQARRWQKHCSPTRSSGAGGGAARRGVQGGARRSGARARVQRTLRRGHAPAPNARGESCRAPGQRRGRSAALGVAAESRRAAGTFSALTLAEGRTRARATLRAAVVRRLHPAQAAARRVSRRLRSSSLAVALRAARHAARS